jgi:hypothetical protein
MKLTPIRVFAGLFILIGLFLMVRLGSGVPGVDPRVPTAAPGSTAAPVGYVSRAELGDAWPLTVDDGVLACRDGSVTFTAGGNSYAVNGTAKTATSLPDIDAIWADDPSTPGLKINIAPLIERGLALCR